MAGFRGTQVRLAVLLFSLVLLSCYHTVKSEETVIELNEDNWMQIGEGEWMIKFYAPWCPACRSVVPTWQEFAKHSDDLGIKVAEVDVTKSPEVSGRFMISSLPTFYHAHNGKFRKYPGGRTIQNFMNFVKEKKWEEIEPISSWKSPTSILMTWMGYLIKLSTHLRDAHVTLTESYGLPSWGSYAVFGVVTVSVGLLLGLVIVVITEIAYRSERNTPPPPPAEPRAEQEADEPARANSFENQQPEEAQEEEGQGGDASAEDATKQDDDTSEQQEGGSEGKEGTTDQEEEVGEGEEGTTDQQEGVGEGEEGTTEQQEGEGEGEEGTTDQQEGVGEEEERAGDEEGKDEPPKEVDEIIEDKAEEKDDEHTEVRHRKPVPADD